METNSKKVTLHQSRQMHYTYMPSLWSTVRKWQSPVSLLKHDNERCNFRNFKTLRTDLTQIDSYLVLTEAVIHHMKKCFRKETPTFHTKLVQMVKLHKVLHQK